MALNKARVAQVAIARQEAARTIAGALKALIASDATRYAASEHCNPDKISRPETKRSCDQIAKLEAKKAAAEERAKIHAKLSEVDHETVFDGPYAKGPYAESFARLLSVFGFTFTEDGKALLSSSKDCAKAIGLELLAAFVRWG